MLDSNTTPESEIRASIETAQAITETKDQVIHRLASLSPLDYDRVRKEEAGKLGASVSALDEEVKQQRIMNKAKAEASDSLFNEPEEWREVVVPSSLLDDIASTFRRYAVLPAHADTALALWVTFSWCIDAFKVAPLLALSSPEKRCGKSTVLTLVSMLVRRPLPTSNISPAAMFRAVEKWQPTLLIDEADTFLKSSDELRGIINSGHTITSAYVIRTVGDEHEPTRFSTWSAKAIALIGHLPDTLHDRSIVVELRRKLAGEKPEKLRHADDGLFKTLQRKLARFAQDNMQALRLARPALVSDISDRAADNWEPLLAIAELAGVEWQAKAVKAAKALSGYENDAPSTGVELLADIQEVFETKKVDRIASTALMEALCSDDDKTWATYNRGRPMSPRQFAKRLGEYKIHNKSIRINYEVVKGFEVSQFKDAFSRYLAPPSESVTPLHASVEANHSVTETPLQATTKGQKVTAETAETLACNRVTDFCPVSGGAGKRVEVEL